MLLGDIIPTKNIRLGHIELKLVMELEKDERDLSRLTRDDLPPIGKMLAELRRTLKKFMSA